MFTQEKCSKRGHKKALFFVRILNKIVLERRPLGGVEGERDEGRRSWTGKGRKMDPTKRGKEKQGSRGSKNVRGLPACDVTPTYPRTRWSSPARTPPPFMVDWPAGKRATRSGGALCSLRLPRPVCVSGSSAVAILCYIHCRHRRLHHLPAACLEGRRGWVNELSPYSSP